MTATQPLPSQAAPVENPAITSAAAEVQTDASRGPLTPPEHAAQVSQAQADQGVVTAIPTAALRDPVRPPEASAAPITQVPHEAAIVAASPAHPVSPVVTAEAYSKAESNLATYLATKLNPAFVADHGAAGGLVLTFSNVLSDGEHNQLAGTDLRLCLKGPMVAANFAELQRELILALRDHPVIKGLFKDHTTLMIDQVAGEDAGQMMHLHLPHMTPQQYATLINALAAGIGAGHEHGAVAAPKVPHKEEAAAVVAAEPVAVQPVGELPKPGVGGVVPMPPQAPQPPQPPMPDTSMAPATAITAPAEAHDRVIAPEQKAVGA